MSVLICYYKACSSKYIKPIKTPERITLRRTCNLHHSNKVALTQAASGWVIEEGNRRQAAFLCRFGRRPPWVYQAGCHADRRLHCLCKGA